MRARAIPNRPLAGWLLAVAVAVFVAAGHAPKSIAATSGTVDRDRHEQRLTRHERFQRRERARVRAERRLAHFEAERDRVQTQVNRVLDARDNAEDMLDRATAIFEEHLVLLYEHGDRSAVAELAAARDVSDAVARVDMMYRLAEHDRRVLDEYLAAVDRVESLAQRAEVVRDQLVNAEIDVNDARSELVSLTGPPRRIGNGGPDDPTVLDVSNVFSTSWNSTLTGLYGSGLGGLLTGSGSGTVEAKPDGLILGQSSEQGVASWYGPGFDGKQTANGETYDQFAMTAAHKSLPFGTWVRVTSVATGAYVEVRINDRGPYVDGRIIDLSYAAAQKIGMDGTAEVIVQPYVAATDRASN